MNIAPFWRSITTRIFGALVGVSVLCIAVSVVSLSIQARDALRSGIANRNVELARQASREISRYITDSIEELGSLGSILGPLPYDLFIRQTVLSNLSLEVKRFRWIAILGPDGAIVADSRLGAPASAPLDAETVANVLSNNRIVSPVRIGADFTPFIYIATPVHAGRGTRGWLVAELYLRSIWDLVDAIAVGGKPVGYLVTSAGKLIAHPDKVRVLSPGEFAPVAIPPKKVTENGMWLVEKERGVEKYLTAYARVTAVDWILAVQQPVEDAFLPASVLLRQAIMLVAIGVAMSLLLGVFISRAISAPLVNLLRGTKIITAGDLAHRISIRGGEEIRGLAQSFNTMVESLQARTAQLVESEKQHRMMTERVNDIIFMLDEAGTITFLSPRLEAITGYQPEEFIGLPIMDQLPDHERERAHKVLRELLEGRGRVDREIQVELAATGGRKMTLEAHLTAETGPGGRRQVYGVARDVSERARLLEQLSQAQKMEAVGRLAGGVAHDFNNLLTAIIGYCDYSMLSLDDTATLVKNIEEIKKAGNRAAGLTQQLLAFSRRQVMMPKILDLNRLIVNVDRLLLRLIGENISLETRFEENLGSILADPGQIEQIIMNLCINARDAMPRGGRIVMETSNVFLRAGMPESRLAMSQGDYVRLRISDNGIGMDEETKSHLFEPFFTTKDVGKGTGLGLSTVYGIVKQTGGYIWVESEPGLGTSFDIYFPGSKGTIEPGDLAAAPMVAQGGTETILVVEDESVIRNLVRNVLCGHGYTVLEAAAGERAEVIFKAHTGEIDLIVTDVVLPGVSGRELVEHLAAAQPGIPALYMSGYSRDVIDTHGVLHAGIAFMQKPFTPQTLLLKVREILDGRRRS